MAQHGDNNLSHHPLADTVLCCTSIPAEQRSTLAAVAAQMGARHVLDLTSDVTHLIAGELDTPKYNYVAKERPEVKVVLPIWIEAVRQSWMEGGETRVEDLEREYRVPTLYGLRVCITGFDDMATRKQLEELISANGAKYCGDLNKEVSHLIAKSTTGLKYQYARSWGIRVVAVEWLEQSLERGMALNERLFDPTIEPSARGQGAWVRRAPQLQPRKRKAAELVRAGSGRKLRRTASAKFDSQSDGMWTGIVGAENQAGAARRSEWDDASGSVVEIHLDSVSQPDSSRPATARTDSGDLSSTMGQKLTRGMFEGRRFYLHGFDGKQTSILENHLRSHNAEIVSDMAQLTQASARQSFTSSFVVIPHRSRASDVPATPDLSSQLVNDLWVEQCLHKKQYVDPSANVIHKPFPFPIQGFEGMLISSTAFEGIELLHVGKAVELLGAKYEGVLTRHISVLVCNTTNPNREKIKHAIRWNVPAVNAQWLWDCIRHNEKRNFDDYLLYPDTAQAKKEPEPKQDTNPDGSPQPRRPSGAGSRFQARSRSRQSRERSSIDQAGPFREASVSDASGAADAGEPNVYTNKQSASRTAESIHSTAKKPSAATRPDVPSPLQERSPNATPRTYPTSRKSSDASSEPADSLRDAISSLLVHHKTHQGSANASAASSFARPGSRGANHAGMKPIEDPNGSGTSRRKRKLLGRALSNLSSHSAERSVQVSPAKSIASANTDGLGTPIELPPELESKPKPKKKEQKQHQLKTTNMVTPGLMSDEKEADVDAVRPPVLTQVGYEDEEARCARMSLVKKMNGQTKDEEMEGDVVEVGVPEKKARIMRDEDEGIGGIAKRTRRAAARY